MKHKYIFLIIPFIISCLSKKDVYSYESIYDSYKEYNTYTLLNLDTLKENNETYIEYENTVAIIFIRTKDFIDFANDKIAEESLCQVKIKALRDVRNIVRKGKGFYFIQKSISPMEYKRYSLPRYRKYKKNYIEPYGFSIMTDTIGKENIAIKGWMISSICLEGNCLVLDKRTNTFSDEIYYIITDFKVTCKAGRYVLSIEKFK